MGAIPNGCKVVVRCGSCGTESRFCVPVPRGVPDFVRCDHAVHGGGGGSAAGGLSCHRCGRAWLFDWEGLAKRVADALHRRPSEWRRIGAVVVTGS